MITKITKLKNFGIFHDFSWNKDIPEFKRFNLIYGWNRSGKTLLSRIFTTCEKKSTAFKEYPKKDGVDGIFEIKTDTHSTIKSWDIANFNLSVKVFNQDFIDENISFDPSNSSNPIVYISEKDIESKKKLEDLKEDNEKLIKDFGSAQKEKIKTETAEEKFRIATAQNIKATVGSMKMRDKYYDYNRSSLKTTLNNFGIDNFKKLSDEDFDEYKKIISSEAKKKQTTFPKYELNIVFDGQNISSFDGIFKILSQLLSKKVISETLERLKNDQVLNAWVKQGYDLHKKKEEIKKCLFCQKPLDDGFLDSLSKHFSRDYENLQSNTKTFISKLEILKKEKITKENSELYFDLQSDYYKQAKNLNDLIENLNKWIDETIKKLQEKFKNPLSVVDPPDKPEDFENTYGEIIKELNEIVQQHNGKVDNHDEEVKTAKEKLELHLIDVAIEEQNYKKTKQDLEDSIEAEKTAKEKLGTNNEKIKVFERKTSDIAKAVQKINNHLKEFFGREEIKLELDVSKKGYIIKREGQPASNLSEGEKTAIAFSYFIVKVQEKDFRIKEGIIFIDDPISSFDSNFIYHCFSVMKYHFEDAGQLFITTHNFELFNLVKEWFLRKCKKVSIYNKDKKDSEKKIVPCEFTMIENFIKDNKRHAQLKKLEKTLLKFKSEYHFLFARLNHFLDDSSPEYADFYTIGNIARRFLEIFTNFKIPTTGDLASKIGQLDTKKISEIEKDKVYKLIQEFSHGSDPTSTIEHKDKTESHEAIKVLLNIVAESDPKHFELLKKNIL
ncbi:MAG TPA: hypothetical protein DCK79_08180 [Candidatus Atribacteria bacterium]|nr:hypothetical protein [Candidatus Atribacteria bacterium]